MVYHCTFELVVEVLVVEGIGGLQRKKQKTTTNDILNTKRTLKIYLLKFGKSFHSKSIQIRIHSKSVSGGVKALHMKYL